MNEGRTGGSGAVGLSALLTILAVLCLTMLALLSVSSVRVSGQMSRQSTRTVQAYYDADARANRVLALLRRGEVPDHVIREGNRYQYSCPISEGQELVVEAEVRGTHWQILRWQAVNTDEGRTEDELPVWDGTRSMTAEEDTTWRN